MSKGVALPQAGIRDVFLEMIVASCMLARHSSPPEQKWS